MNLKRLPIFTVLAGILIILMVVRSGSGNPLKSANQESRKMTPQQHRPRLLQNSCSGKFVNLSGTKPTANGTGEGLNDIYISPLDANGAVVIQSAETRKYLCFNHKGQQKLKEDYKSPLCKFKEETRKGFVAYQAKDNPTWALSYNKEGKAQMGKAGKKCRNFIKTASVASSKSEGPDFLRGIFDKTHEQEMAKMNSQTFQQNKQLLASAKSKHAFTGGTFQHEVWEPTHVQEKLATFEEIEAASQSLVEVGPSKRHSVARKLRKGARTQKPEPPGPQTSAGARMRKRKDKVLKADQR